MGFGCINDIFREQGLNPIGLLITGHAVATDQKTLTEIRTEGGIMSNSVVIIVPDETAKKSRFGSNLAFEYETTRRNIATALSTSRGSHTTVCIYLQSAIKSFAPETHQAILDSAIPLKELIHMTSLADTPLPSAAL